MGAVSKTDQLKSAIHEVLISGVNSETKVEQLISVMSQFPDSFNELIVGWLEARVRRPELYEYIDIRYNDGSIVYERMCDEALIRKIIQENALWKPAIH